MIAWLHHGVFAVAWHLTVVCLGIAGRPHPLVDGRSFNVDPTICFTLPWGQSTAASGHECQQRHCCMVLPHMHLVNIYAGSKPHTLRSLGRACNVQLMSAQLLHSDEDEVPPAAESLDKQIWSNSLWQICSAGQKKEYHGNSCQQRHNRVVGAHAAMLLTGAQLGPSDRVIQ